MQENGQIFFQFGMCYPGKSNPLSGGSKYSHLVITVVLYYMSDAI